MDIRDLVHKCSVAGGRGSDNRQVRSINRSREFTIHGRFIREEAD